MINGTSVNIQTSASRSKPIGINSYLITSNLFFIGLLLLTFFVSFIEFQNINSKYAYSSSVLSNAEINIISRVNSIDGAETGLRGYLLTGHPVFLEPYTKSIDGLNRLTIEFDKKIEPLLKDKIVLIQEGSLRKAQSRWQYWASRDVVSGDRSLSTQIHGKFLFDQVRLIALRYENYILSEKTKTNRSIKSDIYNLFLTSAILTGVLILAYAVLWILFNYTIVKPIRTLQSLIVENYKNKFTIQYKLKYGAKELIELERYLEDARIAIQKSEFILQESNDELIRIDEIKTMFLANMAHQIRTPINGVISIVDLLEEEISSGNPEVANYVRLIKESSHSLSNIVNQVLDYSKIQSDKIVLERVPLSIWSVVSEAFETTPSASDQVILRCIIDPAIPKEMYGDPLRLKQILINLISNSIKFTKSGSVTIKVDIEKRTDGSTILLAFEVTDTGVGIPEELTSKIFEPFSQADLSISRKYGGTGLGLSIVNSLIRLMGGGITVKSQVDVGTTFRFIVPFEVREV